MTKYLDKSGVTYLWNKIKGLFTDQSLNTKNKTYAGAINEINTKVGNLTGAFLWKGKFDALPAVTNYEAGNVVGVGKKEYVLTVTEGTKAWEEFGDEGSYLLKTTAEDTYLKKTAGEVKTANLADNAVTSTKLTKGARNPIILTESTTEVDEETYQKLLSGNDVIFKDNNKIIWECITHGVEDDFTLRFGRLRVSIADEYKIYTEEYWLQISTEAPHGVRISKYENAVDVDNSDYLTKSTLTQVLQEIDLTGTDAERKAKLDKFETDWKALTGATDLSGARFIGRNSIPDDGTVITGVLSYDDGGSYVGLLYASGYTPYKAELATEGSLTITPLFSHLEAITIYTDNTPEHKRANLDNIAAYKANLEALGIDTTGSFTIPVYKNDNNYPGTLVKVKGSDRYTGWFNLDNRFCPIVVAADGTYVETLTFTTDGSYSSLTTKSKQIVGAINEVNDKTAHVAFTDVTKLSTNLGKRLIYKGGNVTLSSPITINSNIYEIDFNGATITIGALAKTGISVITGHSHCVIKNLIVSGTWSVNTGTVNNIIDTFSGVENVSAGVTINGTHYGRGFHNCQRLISCKSEIKGANITEGRAYNYCEYLYMCRVGANSKGTGFFHCTSMDSCDIFNGGCTGSELIECSKYTKVSYYVSGNRRYFSDVDNISTKTLQINGINIANIAELSNVIANSSESVNSVPIIDPNDKSIQKMGVVIGNADNGGTGYSGNPTIVVRNTSGNIFINDGHYNGVGCTTKYAAYLVEQNKTDISGKQDKLISGTNIKTINNQTLLGSGNITISGGGSGDVTKAGNNIFTGNNTFTTFVHFSRGIELTNANEDVHYYLDLDSNTNKFRISDDSDMDVEVTGVDTPTQNNSAANKSYVDSQISTALGTVLTQLQNI